MNKNTKTFADEYNKLIAIKSKLESEDVDIDQLVSLIEESTASYKFCQEKIMHIENKLKENFNLENT